MSDVAPLRVYLLDDHELVRRGIEDVLTVTTDIEVVGQSGTAAGARAGILELRPDVAVLDARLPDGSGIEVCRDVRSVDPSIAVVILTSFDDDDALFAAIMAGAAGYVLKQIRGTDLVDAIRRVAGGQSLLDPAVTTTVLERLRRVGRSSPLDVLTDRERAVFDLISQGLTNRQIAAELFLAEKTVKNYVSQVLAKLDLERRTHAVLLAERLRSDRPPL